MESEETRPPADNSSEKPGVETSTLEARGRTEGQAEHVSTVSTANNECSSEAAYSSNAHISAVTEQSDNPCDPVSGKIGTPGHRTKTRRHTERASLHEKKNTIKDNGLTKWLRSHAPREKASPSEVEGKARSSRRNLYGQRRQKKVVNAVTKDDALRIKNRVRYLLNKMNREQTLIDAYAGDGWNGQSVEKVRPEQELRRAEMQILQCKLGIRQAMEELHNLSLEGSIADSAFDDEGQIYHDDIFCAKCKSKEFFPENDIILCDGVCNRAFHQYCLEPPLKTEDIPPGDEGWLCPVCDSKFDCLDAINEVLGTELELDASWEKVFPDSVANLSGEPTLPDVKGDWPSEDSSDDDYNPEGENHDKPAKQFEDNSSADATNLDSDSSDSSNDSSGVVFFDEFGPSSKVLKTFNEEESGSEEESAPEVDEEAVIVSGKRQRSDVDYKLLYDEVYGANASDYNSSEDEDYGKKKQAKKSKGFDGENNEATPKDMSKNRSHQEKPDTVPQKRRNSARLPIEVVIKLQEVFKENQLPSKAHKEDLSQQFGLTFDEAEGAGMLVFQVNTWFKNARRAAIRRNKINEHSDSSKKGALASDLGSPMAERELIESHEDEVYNGEPINSRENLP